jgi:hypothetical protein
MGVLIGVRGRYSLSQWKALGYDHEREPVGSYMFQPHHGLIRAAELSVRPIAVECPYCHRSLEILDPRCGEVSGRVLHATRKGDMIETVLDPLPPTLHAARCPQCRSVFTTPK